MGLNKDSFDIFIEEMSGRNIQGWDFSYITNTGRIATEPLPWSYASLLLNHVVHSDTMLDMGTGEGEFLSMLGRWAKKTYATERYASNVDIAKARLEPLGISVCKLLDNKHLPFTNDMFNLIANLHESFYGPEVYRILAKGGQFITQQVGGINDIEINKRLNEPLYLFNRKWNLKIAMAQLEEVGLKIDFQDEYFPYTRFYDIGAVIYYLMAVEHQVSQSSIGKYYDHLKAIHDEIKSKGYIVIKSHRFIIKATK